MRWWEITLSIVAALWIMACLFIGLFGFAFSFDSPYATMANSLLMVVPITLLLMSPSIAWFWYNIYKDIKTNPAVTDTIRPVLVIPVITILAGTAFIYLNIFGLSFFGW